MPRFVPSLFCLCLSTTGFAVATTPSEFCRTWLPRLKQPAVDDLRELTRLLSHHPDSGVQLLNGALARLRKPGVSKEDLHQVLGAFMAKVLQRRDVDPFDARYAAAIVLKGADDINDIRSLLTTLRSPEAWKKQDTFRALARRARERTASTKSNGQQEPRRLIAAREAAAANFDGVIHVDPRELGFRAVTPFSAEAFRVPKERLEPNDPDLVGARVELAAFLDAVKSGEKIVAAGSSQIAELIQLNPTKLGSSADLVTMTVGADGAPLIHVRECKNGGSIERGIGQITATVRAILAQNPKANIGKLELIVPDTADDAVSASLINVDGNFYTVTLRKIAVPPYETDRYGFLIPQ